MVYCGFGYFNVPWTARRTPVVIYKFVIQSKRKIAMSGGEALDCYVHMFASMEIVMECVLFG